jgi:hypothetical protein
MKRASKMYRQHLCDCGKPARYRLRIRQLDAQLFTAHRTSLYLCEACLRLEVFMCHQADARLPYVTCVLTADERKHLSGAPLRRRTRRRRRKRPQPA